MRQTRFVAIVVALLLLPLHSFLRSQGDAPFDPHVLDGVWRGDGAGNGRWDNPIPEPPLTDWAKKNLLYASISHDPFSGTLVDAKRQFMPFAAGQQHNYFKTDRDGVPANDVNGEYPGKDCEPLSTPATYDYPNSMELVSASGGSRIFQMFEYHHEWRTFRLNSEHPKDVDETFEGDSIAKWDGTTLEVETIGYNGKTMVSGVVGHRKSEEFRLVERFRLVDRDHLELDMTYYDPKAWGDRSWPGFRKYYRRVKDDDPEEFICSPREYVAYEASVTQPFNAAAQQKSRVAPKQTPARPTPKK